MSNYAVKIMIPLNKVNVGYVKHVEYIDFKLKLEYLVLKDL